MSKKINIAYWIVTGLFAGFMIFSAIPDILVVEEAVTFMSNLGYPAYILPFIGWAKVLGGLAIIIPGFPRIKEWAYAGLVFDLAGAAYSVAVHDSIANAVPFLMFFAFAFGSYYLYHRRLKIKEAIV